MDDSKCHTSVSARGAHEAHETTAGVTHLCRRLGRVGRMRRQQVSHCRMSESVELSHRSSVSQGLENTESQNL